MGAQSSKIYWGLRSSTPGRPPAAREGRPRDRSPAPDPLPRAGGRALRLRRARRGDPRPERRPPRLVHPFRPRPPRAGGRLHGGRLGAAHGPGGGVPGDPRAGGDEPHHRPGRRGSRSRAGRRDHRPAGAGPPPQGVPPVRRHRRGIPALHEMEHAGRDGRGHPRGCPEGVQDRPGGEARGLPPGAAGGRGRGSRGGRAAPGLQAAPPVARPAVPRARGGHHQPGGAPADPRRQRGDPRAGGAGARTPRRARADPRGDDVHGQGRAPRRPPAHGHDGRAHRRGHRAGRLHQGGRHRGRGLRPGRVRAGPLEPRGARPACPHRLHGGRG
jgi:hypothetical protein